MSSQIQVLPLAPLQAGLLFHALGDDSALDVYSIQSTYRFAPGLSAEVVEQACTGVLSRHEMLRAGFTTAVADQPVQFIPDQVTLPWRVLDLSASTPDEAEALLEAEQSSERQRRFDMDRPPLIRFVFVLLPDGDSALIVTNHHILIDGWSEAIVVIDLLTHIAAGGIDDTLPPAPRFSDYLAWLAERGPGARDAWRRELEGLASGTLVAEPTDAMVLPEVTSLDLGAELVAEVEALSRRCGVSVSAVYSTVWGLVLRSLTGSDDVVFGVTVSGRPAELAGVEQMVGLFLNTLPQRMRYRPQSSVAELLAATRAHQAAVIDAHHAGLSDIQRDAGVGPLFDTLYVMRNTPEDDERFEELRQATGLKDLDGGDATHYPLTFIVHPDEEQLILSYRGDAFSEDTAHELLERARRLLTAMTRDESVPVGAITALAEEDSAQLLATGCEEARALPEHSLVAGLEVTARRWPDRVAVVCDGRELDYSALWSAVAAQARALQAAGVRPGDVVAIDLPRDERCVTSIFGILAAGAAYVPLDQSHPAGRRRAIIAAAGAAAVISAGGEAVPDPGVTRLAPATPGQAMPSETAADLHPGYSHRDLAYLIFTSGSTGEPKGVAVDHDGLVNMLANHRRRIFTPAGADPQDPFDVAHTVSFSFDMSWEELLWLVDGHRMHVLSDTVRHDLTLMAEYLRDNRIDVINVTPSVAQALIDQGLLSSGHRPGLVLLGGEAVSAEVWSALREATVGYNLYGPTEYTINTLGGGTLDSATPVVGRPIDNTGVYVLDSALQPVDDGVPGELWITGVGLARGYHGQPGLTAERFVANPYGPPGSRMYRTGDVVSRRPDGLFDFHGRNDSQVKIRGHRVEPGEVQAVLAGLDGVGPCAVVPMKRGASTILVAYVVGAGGRELTGEDTQRLRAELAAVLPDHMTPAAVIALPRLPLTANSKLDVAALPAPDLAGEARIAPRTPLEEAVCEVFAEVLGVEVGAEDDFYALGGHSLSAMRAASLLSARLGERVSVAALMAAPSPASLSRRFAEEHDHMAVVLPLGGRDDTSPVFMLHPAIGLGWSFATFAARIPGRPRCYAVQSPGLSGWGPAGEPASITELADRLALAVLDTLPVREDRRCRLVGWSFGAHLAPLLIERLTAAGVQVDQLLLLDPGQVPSDDEDEDAPEEPSDLEQDSLEFLLATSLRRVPEQWARPYDRAAVLRFLADGTGPLAACTSAEIDAMIATSQVNSRLLNDLGTPGLRMPHFDVPTLLVSSRWAMKEPLTQEELDAQAESWLRHCPQVRQIVVGIDHMSMTSPSAADQIMTMVTKQTR